MTERATTGFRRYFFVHIQKTAGTALRRRLANHFDEEAVYPAEGLDGDNIVQLYISVQHLRERLRARGDRIEVVTGHFPLCVAEAVDGPWTTLTLLREPVDRALSYLRYRKRTDDASRHLSLEEIYSQPLLFRSKLDNHMTKMLSMQTEEMNAGMLTLLDLDRDHLERAKQALAGIDSVGLQEGFEDFCTNLADRYGWDLGEPQTVNVTEPANVPDSLRVRIAEDNALDIELYRFAKEMVEARMAALPGEGDRYR